MSSMTSFPIFNCVEEDAMNSKILIISCVFILINGLSWAESDNIESNNVEWIGQASSKSCSELKTIYAVGNYAYAGGIGFCIFDVSDPKVPKEINFYECPIVNGIDVAGSYAYLATRDGLYIKNISDPENHDNEGFYIYKTENEAVRIRVIGKTAYLVDTNNIHIIDISNPKKPTLIKSKYIEDGYAGSITVAGKYAYIALGSATSVSIAGGMANISITSRGEGLVIYDVSNPSNPSKISLYDSDPIRETYVSGKYVYYRGFDGMRGNGGIGILDVSNPSVPKRINFFEVSHNSFYVDNGYAYLGGYREEGIHVIDISDAANIHVVGFYRDPNFWGIGVDGIYAANGYIYTANRNEKLYILRYLDDKINSQIIKTKP